MKAFFRPGGNRQEGTACPRTPRVRGLCCSGSPPQPMGTVTAAAPTPNRLALVGAQHAVGSCRLDTGGRDGGNTWTQTACHLSSGSAPHRSQRQDYRSWTCAALASTLQEGPEPTRPSGARLRRDSGLWPTHLSGLPGPRVRPSQPSPGLPWRPGGQGTGDNSALLRPVTDPSRLQNQEAWGWTRPLPEAAGEPWPRPSICLRSLPPPKDPPLPRPFSLISISRPLTRSHLQSGLYQVTAQGGGPVVVGTTAGGCEFGEGDRKHRI